jgi:phosphopantothenate---cysteine ligase (CTP)
MNILVTAGNTQTPIDRVRCITNVFTGRTGAAVALEAHARGHRVTLLTSHPEAVAELRPEGHPRDDRWQVFRYRTFDELQQLLDAQVPGGGFNAVIHAAAINDYESAGIFAPAEGTHFDPSTATFQADGPPRLLDRAAGKVKSDEPELWLRLVRAPKLIDKMRSEWGFRGALVKFKLEVGKTNAELLDIAEKSRRHSQADLMVANTLEDAAHWAFLGPFADGYHKVSRRDLAARLLDAIEGAAACGLAKPE